MLDCGSNIEGVGDIVMRRELGDRKKEKTYKG